MEALLALELQRVDELADRTLSATFDQTTHELSAPYQAG